MSYYGSKEWANSLLRIAIADCRDLARDPGSCSQEILYIKRELLNYGFVWQSTVLGFHYNLRLRNLRRLRGGRRLRGESGACGSSSVSELREGAKAGGFPLGRPAGATERASERNKRVLQPEHRAKADPCKVGGGAV